MAKGNFSGFSGGGMNMNAMKKIQQMQQEMLKIQAELEQKEYSASAGGGLVKAVVNGKHEVKALEVDPDAFSPDDAEMICDTIIAAINEAFRQADLEMSGEMSKFTGGLGF